ncbi:MAG: TonB-dependent receptor [Alphaproteobacteria bacterium]|nr:TonB-dependent receptor [Alphaproteobacteria bacterium]MBV9372383.1 TonB-dependent receptor [Alphaproteobacteria bacterium]MBV9902174.1 TonB-dependent receptor [Alphaproteobacteria bacterium]
MRCKRWNGLLIGTGACALLAAPAAGDEAAGSVRELSSLSIEELAQIEVRSASKEAEPISRAPTAIYVITGEDIARSAATSLPEALRLAPNLQVQRIDARQYAVTARGFNGAESSNKLLVLIDGRSVYSTLHSGVFWELHSPLLEDIDQVEVISGPGGTLYGPNAVNGVVNVTSRDARETLGGLARATAGEFEQTLALRYGAPLGKDGAVRVYADGFRRDDLPGGPAPDSDDAFKGWQAGFRGDWGAGKDHVTLQGDLFDTDTGGLSGDGDRGGNLLARWTHRTGADGALQVQAYYDDYRRRFILVDDSLQTFDAEAQINARAGDHHLVVGGGLRTTRDRFINNLNGFHLDPESRRLWVATAFAQDRFAVSPRLDLVAGVKLERSSFSGVELLPNLRLAWHPSERTLFWSAVSRAVRTPSRIDRQLVFLPLLAQATGFRSEKLVAFEAGYRGQPGPRTAVSVNLFYNRYDDIRTTEFAPGGVLPIRLMNDLKGDSYGIEAWATQQLAPWWRASLGVSTLHKSFRLKAGAVDLANRASLGADPDYQFVARSTMDLPHRLQLDLGARAVDDLNETHVGGYVEADARLGWRAADGFELYVAGSSLLHRTHEESSDLGRGQRSRRSVYLGTRVRF